MIGKYYIDILLQVKLSFYYIKSIIFAAVSAIFNKYTS